LKSPVPTTDQVGSIVPRPTPEDTVVPFMNQIARSPLVSCQSRSAMPSPLKSRWPTTDQAVGSVPNPPDDKTVPPFIRQIA
jgi:hypothetical protein